MSDRRRGRPVHTYRARYFDPITGRLAQVKDIRATTMDEASKEAHKARAGFPLWVLERVEKGA